MTWVLLAAALAHGLDAPDPAAGQTVLGIDGTRFTLNGKPTFLLGLSYYGALGAPQEFIRSDLDQARHHGFNWVRAWATWYASDSDVSAVTAEGRPREPYLSRLQWLVAECDRRQIMVDVTLARGKTPEVGGGRLPDFPAHQRAVETVVTALRAHQNWYLDLSNERDVRDDRYVSAGELRTLREVVRRLDPKLLVTASFGGHDLSPDDVRESLQAVGLDFLSPHRPRDAASPSRTESETRACIDVMKGVGLAAPVHYQEPFRRGYGTWEPAAVDFLEDLRGAVRGGAAGWCLHNGEQRVAQGKEPRRSFDLRSRRLFDQLDAEELKVIAGAETILRGPSGAAPPFSLTERDGVSWLVDPAQRQFFSLGVCVTDQGIDRKDYDPAKPGYASWRFYSDSAAWAEATTQRLRAWGFTTIGGWGDFQALRLPAVMKLVMTPVLAAGMEAGVPWFDLWDPGVVARIEELVRKKALPVRDDPRLLGYYTDNEMGWWNGALLEKTFAHPAGSRQRQLLVQLLRDSCGGDWKALLEDFDPDGADSFAALEKKGALFLRPGGNGIRVARRFLGLVAERYYDLLASLVRRHDRRALLLGDRYQSFYYPEVALAARTHVDVVSTNLNAHWNDGTVSRFYLDTLHELTGKPILVSEFYFAASANQSGDPNDSSLYPVVRTQRERAEGYLRTLTSLLSVPYVLGADWFQYYDEPPGGRFDGENFNFGLVDIQDRAYEELIAAARSLDAVALHGRASSKRVNATGGVPRAPADPFVRFEPNLALRDWDRERGFVPPTSQFPLADLYLAWSPEALHLGLFAIDAVEDAYYRDGRVPEADRMEWVIELDGLEAPIRIRLGAGLPPSNVPGGVTALCISGKTLSVRTVAGLRVPAKLLGRVQLAAGDSVRLTASLTTHARAYRMEWKGQFPLAR